MEILVSGRRAGDTVDFLFRAKQDEAAARRYFEKAIAGNGVPETVTIDKIGANLAGLNAIKPGASFEDECQCQNDVTNDRRLDRHRIQKARNALINGKPRAKCEYQERHYEAPKIYFSSVAERVFGIGLLLRTMDTI
jgi:transposase-like protein